MQRFSNIDDFVPPAAGIVLTIGNFDGVHLGHQRLLELARQHAGADRRPVVAMTFDPHPLTVLAPARAPARLTTIEERLALLERHGADVAIVLAPEPAILGMAADAFLEWIVARLRPRVFIEGPTFNFGRGRAGSVQTLKEHAARLGYKVEIADELYGRELGGNPPINSTTIRAAINEGRVEDAAVMLGRPHRLVGTVGVGQGRGGPLGFPTANLDGIAQLLPAPAVYAGLAQLDSGELRPAAVNIGSQPTFEQSELRVEAHLIDFDADLRGARLGLHLVAALRGQTKFASVDALKKQIRLDVDRARRLAAAATIGSPIPL